jgi:serine/threonine-protein kinase HipA
MPERRWTPIIRLEAWYQDDGEPARVGTLAASHGRRIAFQYDAGWVARGLELSPHQLGLRDVGTEVVWASGGPHGLFADALPDAWGERIQKMAFQRLGVSWHDVSPLDQLAALGTRAIGALSFRPAVRLEHAPVGAASFEDLLTTVDELLGGDPGAGDAALLDRLQRAAGTAGGAQPKVLVGLRESDGAIYPDPEPPAGYRPYLVKFSPRTSGMHLSPAHGAIELAYLRMARVAGITVPDARLVRTADARQHFAVARFDRTRAGGRRHVHSLAGLLGRAPADAYDYDELLTVTLALTQRHGDVQEAFARGLFNVLAGNDDDHGRNTSFLLDPVEGWRLAPAYDLVFQPGRGSRGMSILGKDRDIRRADLDTLATRHGIRSREREGIVARVMTAVGGWREVARDAGVPADWIEEIDAVISGRIREFAG